MSDQEIEQPGSSNTIDDLFETFQQNIKDGKPYQALKAFHDAEELATSQSERDALYGGALATLAAYDDDRNAKGKGGHAVRSLGEAFAEYAATKLSYTPELFERREARRRGSYGEE